MPKASQTNGLCVKISQYDSHKRRVKGLILGAANKSVSVELVDGDFLTASRGDGVTELSRRKRECWRLQRREGSRVRGKRMESEELQSSESTRDT